MSEADAMRVAIGAALCLPALIYGIRSKMGWSGWSAVILSGLLAYLFGWLLSLIPAILGPIVIYRDAYRRCPHCQERVLADASVCKHCGRELGDAGACY